MGLLEQKVLALRAKGHPVGFMVVDPLALLLPSSTDTNNDNKTRHALRPLARLAERLGIAALVLRHFTKGKGSKALLRGGGSIGFSAAVRAMLVVVDHPSNDGWKALAVAKMNNARLRKARAFRIVDARLEPTALDPDGIQTSRLEWGEELEMSADELLFANDEGTDGRDRRETCATWLRGFLQQQPDGRAATKAVYAAAESEGYTERAVRLAAQANGVIKTRQAAFGAGSVYSLPEAVHSGSSIQSGSTAALPEWGASSGTGSVSPPTAGQRAATHRPDVVVVRLSDS